MLMPDVYELYSREWQALFDRLEEVGYAVTYRDGALHFESPEVWFTATVHRGKWQVEMPGCFWMKAVTEQDHEAIRAVNAIAQFWLAVEAAKKFVRNLTQAFEHLFKQPTAPLTKNQKNTRPKGGKKKRRRHQQVGGRR